MTNINWYPGHMHKASQALKKLLPKIDIVYEVVDSRAPKASSNAQLSEIFEHKPIIKILTKKDLADPKITQQWLNTFSHSLSFDLRKAAQPYPSLLKIANHLLPNRGTPLKPIRAVIIGIPNVGKSTLINKISNRKIAKTGDTPAVTQQIQTIKVNKNFIIYDSPGVMLKNTQKDTIGLMLSAIGCIRDTAFSYGDIADFIISFFQENKPIALAKRYHLVFGETKDIKKSIYAQILGLTENVDFNSAQIIRASERIVQDFRKGELGQIALEKPSDYSLEL